MVGCNAFHQAVQAPPAHPPARKVAHGPAVPYSGKHPAVYTRPCPPEASGFLVGLRRSTCRASRSMRCLSSSLAVSPRFSGLMASSSCGRGRGGTT